MDKVDLGSAFKDKTVFVTGSTGFKGSWLCMWLNKLGAKVVGYALYPNNHRDNYTICGLRKHIKQVYGNIEDFNLLNLEMKKAYPDYVFHLAAQAVVKESVENPLSTFNTNIIGTANVMEAARYCGGIKSIVSIISDKCYLNTGYSEYSFKEDDKLGGADPYSASKSCADIVTASFYDTYFKSKGVGVARARGGNVIGGGDRTKYRIVPDCIASIERGENIVLRNPDHVRPWQYVLDPIYGYLVLGARLYEDPGKYSSGWNFGPLEEKQLTVGYVADKILKCAKDIGIKTNTVCEINESARDNTIEKKLLSLNCDKAHMELGVRNIINTDTGIEWSVGDYFCGGDIFNQRMSRIEQYERML